MNKLEQPKRPEADLLIFAAGIVTVALGATVIYALAVLGRITSLDGAVWALVTLGAVGMTLATVGVLARSSRRELRRRAQEEQLVTKVRLPRLYPRDIRDDANQSNDWRK